MKAVIDVKMHGNMFKGRILVPNMDHCLQLHLINGNIKIFVNIDPDPPFPLIRGFQIPKINWLIMNNQSVHITFLRCPQILLLIVVNCCKSML